MQIGHLWITTENKDGATEKKRWDHQYGGLVKTTAVYGATEVYKSIKLGYSRQEYSHM